MKSVATIFAIVIFYFASAQSKEVCYYSYPDRTFKVTINTSESSVIWQNQRPNSGQDEYLYHYTKIKDTLLVKERDVYGDSLVIVCAGKYLDVRFFSDDGTAQDAHFGIIFMKESASFRKKHKEILRSSNRKNQRLMFELIARLERLRIFNESCTDPLPENKESDFH